MRQGVAGGKKDSAGEEAYLGGFKLKVDYFYFICSLIRATWILFLLCIIFFFCFLDEGWLTRIVADLLYACLL